tara:strand:+ start:1489 stop:1686 length:198 start_codon:yes stop_codon:yes gene_type:complete
MTRPRDYNAPDRIPWNDAIHYIIKSIDNHTRLHLETGNYWHEEQAQILRKYIKDLKIWIHKQEGK